MTGIYTGWQNKAALPHFPRTFTAKGHFRFGSINCRDTIRKNPPASHG
jgi:hypothetical protein